jgi:hypothetical protein
MDQYGNLALKQREVPRSQIIKPVWKRPEIKTRRIPATATPTSGQLSLQRARAIHQALAVQRLKLLALIVLLVFAVTGSFGIVVYRQAMLLELNFGTVSTERKITQMNQEAGQIREALAQRTNFDQIRQQAISRLGLQDPAQRQIVRVLVPDTDRVVFAAPGSWSAEEDRYLVGAFSTIEGFFKTLNGPKQGP